MEIPRNLAEMLEQRAVVLFLGSGASLGAQHPEKKEIVMGDGLAKLIAQRFLSEEYYGEGLEYTAGMAISASSMFEVQSFIKNYLSEFEPSVFHSNIADLAWDSIFTLNYDLIIEKSYEKNKNRVQNIIPFFDNEDKFELKIKNNRDLPFYKLHGCITRSEDKKLPFILSTEQYITHLENRESLFNTLYEKAYRNSIVYIGTSLRDSDIRTIMLKVIQESKGGHARSYLVTPNPRKFDYDYWGERKITILEGSFEEFLDSAKKAISKNSIMLSLHINNDNSRHPLYKRFINDANNDSQLINDFLEKSFLYVEKNMQYEKLNAKNFYKGYGQGFAPIIEGIDVRRNLTDTILENCVLESDSYKYTSLVIITGFAGSGKTVLMRRLAYESSVDFGKLVFWALSPYSIDYSALQEIHRRSNERIFLFIDDANKYQNIIESLLCYADRFKIPLTVISADRSNSWNETKKKIGYYVTDEYPLRNLSESEVDTLIRLLDENNSLGYLSDKSTNERKDAFIKLHGRQLLVSLHEATMGKPFSDIVYDEYQSLFPDEAQYLYRTICTLNRFGIRVRAGLIARIHGISFNDFKNDFFEPLEGVIKVEKDVTIRDFVYETRHRHVAEILFEQIFSSEDERYSEFMRILNKLNVEFKSDDEALIALTNAHNLIGLFSDVKIVRIIYSNVIGLYPSNPYLYQHLAIFEMKSLSGSLAKAKEALERALQLSPHSDSIKHTLANLERKLGQQSTISDLEKAIHRKKAKSIAQDIFSRVSDSYSFVTFIGTKIDELKDSLAVNEDESLRTERINDIQKTIQEAKQKFPDEDRILSLESSFYKLLGDIPNFESSLEKAYSLNKANSYVAVTLAKHFLDQQRYADARRILEDALENNPNNKDLHFIMALSLMGKEYITGNEILYHLRHSFTNGDGRHDATFWYARCLFLMNQVDASLDYFRKIDMARESTVLKLKAKGVVFEDGEEKYFKGTITSVSFNYMFISPDMGSLSYYCHASNTTYQDFTLFHYGERISFKLAFNYKGPVAIEIKK